MTATNQVCVELVEGTRGWNRRNGEIYEGGIYAHIIKADGSEEKWNRTYPPKFRQMNVGRGEDEERRVYHNEHEKTQIIAGWLKELIAECEIPGWIVGGSTLCHFSEAVAESVGIKPSSLKWRRKQVHSICMQEVNPHDPKPCGRPIYEDGMDDCSIHSKRVAKEQQEIAARNAAREAAELEVALRKAELRRVMDIINDMTMAATTKAGVPYPREKARYGDRKGQLEDIHVDSGYYDTVKPKSMVNVPLDVFIAMCEKITGSTYTIEPPVPDEPEVEETEDVTMAGGIVSPFG